MYVCIYIHNHKLRHSYLLFSVSIHSRPDMSTSLNEKLVSSMSEQHYCHSPGLLVVGTCILSSICPNPQSSSIKSDCNPLLFDLQRMKPVVYVALLTLAATWMLGSDIEAPS